ncbi:GH-E family nuclease [Glacieibacterium megasporae]|uniref:GH-E family nuclease n=1 Tax=Glacieibacterium megasporae TaxID=2835787 RepID=UPI001C1E71BD|nr:GH-E family nuclease [Polymorphobacter megasporae]UAJ12724.1 PAAR domain-containing protein [Polymorphobacter megasporae]
MGALAGAAIAAVCATGGLAAVAIAAAGGAGLGGVLGEFVGGFSTYDAGSIVKASEDADTNHVGAARATDDVACDDHGNQKIAEGSKLVHIDGLPAARIGDRTTCGAEISTASDDTNIGGPKEQLLAIDPEVPLAAELIVGALGLIGGVGAIAMAAKGLKLLMAARLAAGLAGGAGFGYEGNKVGGRLFGEGSRGQRQFALGSGLLGGALSSGAAGGRLDPFNYRVKVDPNALGMNGGNAHLQYMGDYARPSGFRTGVRDEVWNSAKTTDGTVIDPVSSKPMDPDDPWDMGHKPGYEFRKHQVSAADRGISRQQFLDEYNNPDHYRPELPSSNRGHSGEDDTDTYLGD